MERQADTTQVRRGAWLSQNDGTLSDRVLQQEVQHDQRRSNTIS